MLRALSFLVCLSGLLFFRCSTAVVTYQHDTFNRVRLHGAKTLLVTASRLSTSYRDDTKASPDTLFSDSFLLAAINGLSRFEAGRQMRVVGGISDTIFRDSSGTMLGYSKLTADTTNLTRMSQLLAAAAVAAGAEMILVVRPCTISSHVFKPQGWRDGKYESSSYDRPTRYVATTTAEMQIWSARGLLLFEKRGVAVCDRPFLYSIFKSEKFPGNDIVAYARRLYAPPLIKSLHQAIKIALLQV